jgi:hypothetical protein
MSANFLASATLNQETNITVKFHHAHVHMYLQQFERDGQTGGEDDSGSRQCWKGVHCGITIQDKDKPGTVSSSRGNLQHQEVQYNCQSHQL